MAPNVAVVTACPDNSPDCGIEVAYAGQVWKSATGQPKLGTLLVSAVEVLDEFGDLTLLDGAELWTTERSDRLILVTNDGSTALAVDQ